jgi:hypothetical protein
MRVMRMLMPKRFLRAALFFTLAYFITGTQAQAQCSNTAQGLNTVYCNNNAKQGSFAIVDASQFSGDICLQIQNAFNKYVPTANTDQYGIVVDARGILPPYSCNSGENPWGNWGYSSFPPSVVLLPSGTISIKNTWNMPAYARLIGGGPGATVLLAATGFSGSDMIDMGIVNNNLIGSFCFSLFNGTYDCPGMEIEHLGVNGNSGNGISVNGIANYYGQELSYVEDVAFLNITGTALSLLGLSSGNQNGTSNNSGPYSNLSMSNVGTCVNINGSVVTRGIHGLTCSTSSSSLAAIYVDGSNNSLEDISLSGANTNGILIGHFAAAQNNVLFNISGIGGFQYLIHIGATPSSQSNCPAKAHASGSQVYNVCDITIMGVTNGSSGTTIWDEIGGATLPDANLGMYILGESVQSGSSSSSTNDTFLGNSHFTTSLNSPTWLVGTGQASGTACPSVGSLYSVTSGSAPTLLECENSGWAPVK